MFHNKDLDRVIEEYSPLIKIYLEDLNLLSEDIENLEEAMEGFGIKSFSMRLNNGEILEWHCTRIYFVYKNDYLPLLEAETDIQLKCCVYLVDFLKKGLETISNRGNQNESIR